MVQKQVQKLVQARSGGSKVSEDHTMPQYMSKSPSGTGYLFRRSVPVDARSIIGKREFKCVLGGDYRAASQRCRELAVETDKQIEAARAGVTMQPSASSESERVIAQSSQLTAITLVSSDLVTRLHATVAEQVERADREQRYLAREAISPAQKLQEVERVRSWARLAQFGDETAAHGWRAMLDGTLKRNGYYLADELRDSFMSVASWLNTVLHMAKRSMLLKPITPESLCRFGELRIPSSTPKPALGPAQCAYRPLSLSFLSTCHPHSEQ